MHQIHTVTLNPVIDLIYEVNQFTKGTTFRADEMRFIPAGKGINVSYALSCMGEESHAYALIGWKDNDLFADACRERGIHFHPHPGVFQTRRHCTILERKTGMTTHVQILGDAIPLGPVSSLIKELTQQIQAGDWVVFSGSVPPSVPFEIYGEMTEQIHLKGGKVLLDSSGDPLRKGVESRPDLLKVNQSEAEELTGISMNQVDDAIRAYRDIYRTTHIPLIAISLGKQGLVAGYCNEVLHLSIEMHGKEVCDTVGCGDAMVAGMLYGLNHGFEPEALFRYGIACASASVLQIGPGQFEWSDMERMLNRIRIREL